jgi:hypothetical protein
MGCYAIFNFAAGLWNILIIAVSCRKRWWRILCTTVHFLLVISAITCVTTAMITDKQLFVTHHYFKTLNATGISIPDINAVHIFNLSVMSTFLHLLFGLLVLPSNTLAARFFSPLVSKIVRLLRRLTNCPSSPRKCKRYQ